MGMRFEHSLDLKLGQELRVTPQMILINRILQLQRLELSQEIELNLKENPALEMIEEKRCYKCGEPLADSGFCRSCESIVEFKKQDDDEFKQRNFDDLVSNWDSGHYEDATTYDRTSQDDEFDPVTNTAQSADIHSEIKRNFMFTYQRLTEIEYTVAEYIIDLIDDRGLVEVTDADIAEELGLLVDVVIEARDKLMHLEPIGLGAENPNQSMQIQLDVLAETLNRDVELEKLIVQKYRDLLARENCEKIAKATEIELGKVVEACAFIKEKLYAYPGDFFETQSTTEQDPDFYPSADVVLREVDGEFYPEVIDSGLPRFRLSPFYIDAYERIRANKAKEFSSEEKKHIKQYFERAKFFLDCVNQRRETIIRICNYLIHYQKDFLKSGIRKLKDLTRETVAKEIGFHPSTISRALKDKYIQLPNHSICSFSIFFDYQKVLILVIREILEREETPSKMLSDDNIAARMSDLGFDVARRTVAKYRERGKIPPKNIRKKRLLKKLSADGTSNNEIKD